MSSFLQQCVARYLELANLEVHKLRKAATPFLELDEAPEEQGGTLQPIASKVLMKILYAARMARHDLLCATCKLASKVTKWTTTCDKQLHRLVSYINSTLDIRSFTWVGNRPNDMNIVLYSDADFAGCKETMRSTTGAFLTIQGTHTFAPLAAVSKKQTCVSHSTPEAELVAADHAVRAEGLPALPLWELLLGRKLQVHLKEDNEAAIKNLLSGKNPNMRHMGRTHKVDFMWLHETVSSKTVTVEYTETDLMAADIFTKSFSNAAKWESLLPLIGHLTKGSFVDASGKRGETRSLGRGKETPSKTAEAMSSSLYPSPDRRIVEYCCGEESEMGKPSPQSKGCEVIRLTILNDVTSDHGHRLAMESVVHPAVLLWASMPCTGGTPLRFINARTESGRRKQKKHLEAFWNIWGRFEEVARKCHDNGGKFAVEWPAECQYWKEPRVFNFLQGFEGMGMVRIDGCRFGLQDDHGNPIKKPWRVATTCSELLSGLQNMRCKCTVSHTPCQEEVHETHRSIHASSCCSHP